MSAEDNDSTLVRGTGRSKSISPHGGTAFVAFESDLLPAVSELVEGRVRTDQCARDYTTFAIGGPIKALVTVNDEQELARVVALLDGEGQLVRVLGNGSNLLVGDAGPSGWVIKLGSGFKRVARTTEGVFVLGGGAALMPTVRKISREGYSGLEFAGGIPASIGGAVFMNAGAHGAEISERILSVRGVRLNGEVVEFAQGELPWRYRNSGLPFDVVVTEVTLALTEGISSEILALCEHNLDERKARQPLTLPSAGSIFKNPRPDLPAGKVLEEGGAKSIRCGGVEVSQLHANWIVNPSKIGTAREVLDVIKQCQAIGKERGFELEPEVRMWDV